MGSAGFRGDITLPCGHQEISKVLLRQPVLVIVVSIERIISYLEIRNLRMGKCFMLKHIWRRVITLWDKSHRDQRSLSFLASGTGFMGDNFSTDQEDMSDGE